MSQSIQATTPARTGLPEAASRHGWRSKTSGALALTSRQRPSWPAASTFTQKAPLAMILGQVVEERPGKNATSGGSRDTEVNEPMTMPVGVPSGVLAVTTVTPVG